MTDTETVLPPPLPFTHSTWDIWESNLLDTAETTLKLLLWLMLFAKADEIDFVAEYYTLSLFGLNRYIIQAVKDKTKTWTARLTPGILKILLIADRYLPFLLWILLYVKAIAIEWGTVYFIGSLFNYDLSVFLSGRYPTTSRTFFPLPNWILFYLNILAWTFLCKMAIEAGLLLAFFTISFIGLLIFIIF